MAIPWTPAPWVVAHRDRVGFALQVFPLETREQDRGYPGLSKGPVLTRVQALSCALALPAQAETRCCHVAYCP